MAFAASFLPVASRSVLHSRAPLSPLRRIAARAPLERKIVRASADPPSPAASSAPEPFPSPAFTASEMADLSPLGTTLASLSAVLLGLYLAGAPLPALAVPAAVTDGFKSIPVSLVHPLTMWLVFFSALYSGYLGWQSRSIRSASPAARKELVKQRVTKRHFEWSASLFAAMTCATFFGMGNTFARAHKLFPGPHLYAGLALVAAMSVMVSLVPAMQGGKLWAKQAHFAIAFPVIGIFGWQAWTGMQIVFKLLKWT